MAVNLQAELKEPSGIPPAAEPRFLGLGAEIDMPPAMTADELRKGLSRPGSRARARRSSRPHHHRGGPVSAASAA